MKPDTYFQPFAQAAYEAYKESTGGKTFDGRDMPTWEFIGINTGHVQTAWIAAVKSVFKGLNDSAVADIADIPYSSQWEQDAHTRTSDCGATCVKMVAASMGIQTTVDALTIESQPNGITSANDLIANFKKIGIQAEAHSNAYHPQDGLKGGDICLVTYGALHGQQDLKFKGLHWLVYLGEEGDDVVTNDPNFFGDRIQEGANKHYGKTDWDTAFHNQFVRATGRL